MQEISNKKSIIKQNISSYLKFKGISEYQCYKETGITRGVLSQNNGISEDNLMRFLACYKEVNPAWLVTGTGHMFLSEKSNTIKGNNNIQRGINSGTIVLGNKEDKGNSNNLKKEIRRLEKLIENLTNQLSSKEDQINKLINFLDKK